jgi:hypothetical protein
MPHYQPLHPSSFSKYIRCCNRKFLGTHILSYYTHKNSYDSDNTTKENRQLALNLLCNTCPITPKKQKQKLILTPLHVQHNKMCQITPQHKDINFLVMLPSYFC